MVTCNFHGPSCPHLRTLLTSCHCDPAGCLGGQTHLSCASVLSALQMSSFFSLSLSFLLCRMGARGRLTEVKLGDAQDWPPAGRACPVPPSRADQPPGARSVRLSPWAPDVRDGVPVPAISVGCSALQARVSAGRARSSSRCASSTAPATRRRTARASGRWCTRTSSCPCGP